MLEKAKYLSASQLKAYYREEPRQVWFNGVRLSALVH